MRGSPASRGSLLAALAVAHLAAAGCGYKLVDYSAPPGELRSVSIRTFANDSYEPGVELMVADALRREFLRRGALSLSDDPETADLVISGEIPRIRTQSRSFSTVALSLEWEIRLDLRVKATLRDGSSIPLDADSLEERERYLASADIEATRKNRDEALRKMASAIAVRVHDMLYEVYTP